MRKEKKLVDLTLSELVDQSLAKGLIPIFEFFDKNEIIDRSQPENKSNDSFQWTDFLVEEFAMGFLASRTASKTAMEQFKNDDRYRQTTWSREKFIEGITSTTPKPQADNKPDRDWEVIEYSCKYGGQDNVKFHRDIDGKFIAVNYVHFVTPPIETEERIKEGKGVIIKVHRFSDGQVFSVGDEVDCTEAMDSFKRQKIKKFAIASDGHMRVDCAGVNCSIQYIQKPQPQKEEQWVTLTKEKLDAMCEDAFNAGRRMKEPWRLNMSTLEYYRYEDYKSKKSNQ